MILKEGMEVIFIDWAISGALSTSILQKIMFDWL